MREAGEGEARGASTKLILPSGAARGEAPWRMAPRTEGCHAWLGWCISPMEPSINDEIGDTLLVAPMRGSGEPPSKNTSKELKE